MNFLRDVAGGFYNLLESLCTWLWDLAGVRKGDVTYFVIVAHMVFSYRNYGLLDQLFWISVATCVLMWTMAFSWNIEQSAGRYKYINARAEFWRNDTSHYLLVFAYISIVLYSVVRNMLYVEDYLNTVCYVSMTSLVLMFGVRVRDRERKTQTKFVPEY